MRPILFPLLALLAAASPAGADPLRVVYNENYPPLSFPDSSGMRGVEVDIFAELGRRMNIAVASEGLPWERAQLQVKAGTSDAFLTVATPERLEYALMSAKPVLTVRMAAATAKTNPRLPELMKLKSLEETFPYPQVNYLGSGWAKVHLAQAHVDYLSSTEAIFRFLLANRADVYIETDINLYFNSHREGIQDKVQVLPIRGDSTELRVGISKRSPFAPRMPEFNRVVSEMVADGTVNRILAAYGIPHGF
jgi:polar amino acid transport system substrate-binding protein